MNALGAAKKRNKALTDAALAIEAASAKLGGSSGGDKATDAWVQQAGEAMNSFFGTLHKGLEAAKITTETVYSPETREGKKQVNHVLKLAFDTMLSWSNSAQAAPVAALAEVPTDSGNFQNLPNLGLSGGTASV